MQSIQIPKCLDSSNFQDLIRLLNGIQDCKYIKIDFTETQFVFPGGITPLFAYLIKVNEDKKIEIIKSKNQGVNNYLQKIDFFEMYRN